MDEWVEERTEEWMWEEFIEKYAGKITKENKKINHENCVEICWNSQKFRDKIEEELNHLANKPVMKDEKKAAHFKRIADSMYKCKNYEGSLRNYSNCITNAKPGSKCLALAYSGRSQAALKLGFFEQSIKDIDMALKIGLPEAEIPVVKLRKAKAWFSLKTQGNNKEFSFDYLNKHEPNDLLDSLTMPELDNILRSLDEQQVPSLSIEKPCDINYDLPRLVGGNNINFSCASAHIALVYNEHKGRHVIATEDLNVGDVLFVEKAFAHCYHDYKKTCDACGREVISFIPCETCTLSVYCSIDCKNKFWKSIHSFECRFGSMLDALGVAHLSLRVLLSASSSFSDLSNKLDHLVTHHFCDGPVSMKKNDYNEIYNLVTNLDKFDSNDLIQYTLSAMIIVIYLRNHTPYFRKRPKDKDLKLLVSILLRHTTQIICNGQTISGNVFRCKDDQSLGPYPFKWKMSFKPIGTGIYPSISMMNHSCVPSVISTFRGIFSIVRASKFIKKGEEVFNCYIPQPKVTPRSQRQNHIQLQYFFKCECQACTSDYDISEVLTAWKCPKCFGPLIKINNESLHRTCLNCACVFHINENQEILEHRSYKYLNKGEDFMMTGIEGYITTLSCFLSALSMGRRAFYKYHRVLIEAAHNISVLMYDHSEYEASSKFQYILILYALNFYGPMSIQFASMKERICKTIFSLIHEILCRNGRVPIKEARRLAFEVIEHLDETKKIYEILCGQSEHTIMFDALIDRAQRIIESIPVSLNQ